MKQNRAISNTFNFGKHLTLASTNITTIQLHAVHVTTLSFLHTNIDDVYVKKYRKFEFCIDFRLKIFR